MQTTTSQNLAIRAMLESGGRLTPLEALNKFGCLRLSGRIFDLKKQGMKIHTKMVERGGKRVAEYSMRDPLPEKKKISL